MAISSPWVTTELTFGGLGDGVLRMRHRRTGEGQLLFAVQFVMGASTILGAAQLISLTGLVGPRVDGASGFEQMTVDSADTDYLMALTPAWASNPGGTERHEGVGVVFHAANDGIEGGPTAAVTPILSPFFGGLRWGASNPFTWAEGDVMVAGNAFEAFGN